MSKGTTAAATNAIGEFDVESFEQKLTTLKDTQDGIQQMSAWCLQQRAFHKKIVSCWLNVLKQVRVEHRLTLFYLANDVIQYSKKKNYEFVESWGTALQKATTMVRDEKVRNKIFRIFKIWEEREIYSEEYLSDLNGLLSMNPVKKTQQSTVESSDDFQNSVLISNIRECVKFEKYTDKNFKNLPKAPNCDIETIKTNLKDRSHSDDAEKDIDEYVIALESYIKCLKSEIKSRKSLINLIVQADTFYTNQRGEVKVVVNAYKNFGNRIKLVKKKLDEITPNLPSPIPSPDINAPSPEQDADIVLPDDQSNISINMFKNPANGYASYMDGNLPFDINDFKRESPKKTIYDTNAGGMQQIQVINNRSEQKSDSGYDMNDFFKTNDGSYSAMDVPVPVPPVSNYGTIGQQQSTSIASSSSSYSNNSIVGNVYTNNPSQSSYSGGYNDSSYGSSSTNTSYDTQMPLMPPPMPPLLGVSPDDFNSTWDMDMSWTSINSNTSTFNTSVDTPVSPPHFEREGVNQNLVEYMEGGMDDELVSLQDVDHRQLRMSSSSSKMSLGKEKARTIDVDHRNLISLTGSPGPRSFENKRKHNTSPTNIWSSSSVSASSSSSTTTTDKDNRLNSSTSFQKQSEVDVDYRRQMSSGDVDYRTQNIQQQGRIQNRQEINTEKKSMNTDIRIRDGRILELEDTSKATIKDGSLINNSGTVDKCEKSLIHLEPPPPGTLHPPPPLPSLDASIFPNLNNFLSSPPNFNSSKPPPEIHLRNNNGNQINKEGEITPKKSSGRDNVESIDMDMSDEDLEDLNRDSSQQTSTIRNNVTNNNEIDNIDNPTELNLLPSQGNHQRPPLLQTPDIQPWIHNVSITDPMNNDMNSSDISASMMWKPRMSSIPTFRVPLNPQQQQQQQQQHRSSFMQSPRVFNSQLKQNFRDSSSYVAGGGGGPRNSPYFNSRGGGGSGGAGGGRNNGRNRHRGGFRGSNKWQ